jgi:hypothetical protein
MWPGDEFGDADHQASHSGDDGADTCECDQDPESTKVAFIGCRSTS